MWYPLVHWYIVLVLEILIYTSLYIRYYVTIRFFLVSYFTIISSRTKTFFLPPYSYVSVCVLKRIKNFFVFITDYQQMSLTTNIPNIPPFLSLSLKRFYIKTYIKTKNLVHIIYIKCINF